MKQAVFYLLVVAGGAVIAVVDSPLSILAPAIWITAGLFLPAWKPPRERLTSFEILSLTRSNHVL